MPQEYTWISRCLVSQSDHHGIIKKYILQIACNACDDVDLHRKIRDLATHQAFSLESIEYSRLIQDHLDRMDHYDQESITLASESARNGFAIGKLEPLANASPAVNADGKSLLTISNHPITHQYNPQKPSWQQPWIDPKLKQCLFEQKYNTFLLIDATSRNRVTSTFDLEDYDDIEIRSLYSGQLAKELKHQAPYVLDVTLGQDQLSDDNLVPKFHRDFFSKHWGHNTGIFLHSDQPIEKVVFHLKKFIKIRNEKGQWFYFRFFDPRTMNHYLQSIQRWPQRVAKWFGANQGNELIKSFFCEDNAGQLFQHYQLTANHQLNHSGNLELTDAEFKFFKDYQWQQNKKLVEVELRQDFPQETADLAGPDIHKWLEAAAKKGYTTPRALYDYGYSVLMATTYGFDLSEIEQYLSEQTSSHLEKSKLLYQSTKDAVERYAPGRNT